MNLGKSMTIKKRITKGTARQHYYIMLPLILCGMLLSSCQGMGPTAMGEAAAELTILAPGDKIKLNNGDTVYVDAEGYLQGIPDVSILAVNKKARDVMTLLSTKVKFDRYRFLEFGKRYVEVAGAVRRTGRYNYPLQEDWSLMNLLIAIQGITSQSKTRPYLLVRNAWEFPGGKLFIRGESLPLTKGMGGDDLLLFAGDQILFPGDQNIIYVFGAVHCAVCFTFDKNDDPPTLKIAIEKAGGFLKVANTNNIQLYRVLRESKQSIFQLSWKHEQKRQMNAWDIIYVPFLLPKHSEL